MLNLVEMVDARGLLKRFTLNPIWSIKMLQNDKCSSPLKPGANILKLLNMCNDFNALYKQSIFGVAQVAQLGMFVAAATQSCHSNPIYIHFDFHS